MKAYVAAMLGLSVCLGATGAPAQDLIGEYEAAHRTFRSSLSRKDQISGAHRVVLDGIEGRWTDLATLFDGMGATAAILDQVCRRFVFVAERTGDFSFTLTKWNAKQDKPQLTFTYTAIGSNAFVKSADAGEVMAAFGMNTSESSDDSRLTVLRSSNATVEVFRPSANIVVIKPMLGIAEIYGRCPTG